MNKQLSLFDNEPVKPILQKSDLNIGDIVKVLSTGFVGTIAKKKG
jgi:hypothetical protein